jgi:hypothetical protein
MSPKVLQIACIFLLSVMVCGTSFAKKKNHASAGVFASILEISPMSVTIDAGKDVQETYTVNSDTKATLNGVPVNPGDLRAGMVAQISLAPDNQTVLTITAKPAPRETKKPVKPKETIWVNGY